MTHPIYNSVDKMITLPVIKSFKNEDSYQKELFKIANMLGLPLLPPNEVSTITIRALIIKQIMSQGHTLIKVTSNEWESDITKSTLEKLRLKDLNFAFKSGTIVVDNTEIFFAYLDKDVLNNEVNKTFNLIKDENGGDSDFNEGMILISANDKVNGGQWYIQILDNELLFEKITEKETASLLNITLSVLIYSSMFKSDKNRVVEKLVNCKKSSKKGAPQHRTNVVKLYQIEAKETEVKDGTSWKSNKKWLVRGHLRNQFYSTTGEHKQKWIDPYFKGIGKEEIQKVYKIQ